MADLLVRWGGGGGRGRGDFKKIGDLNNGGIGGMILNWGRGEADTPLWTMTCSIEIYHFEENVGSSYLHFHCHIPKEAVNPRPEDWSTSLCRALKNSVDSVEIC